MKNDPWYKTYLPLTALGSRLELCIPHDVFSTARIDEGTLLLLDHLPATAPRRVLDMGCGYGALGLPVAARHPQARVELVDRDLLAVAWAAANAQANRLPNVHVHGSLGFRDLAAGEPYDWILCNVPARIGRPFIAHLLEAGRSRLSSIGELRIVVIRDLAPTIEALRSEQGWSVVETARGPRHIVYSLAATPSPSPLPEPPDLYNRDQVEIGGLVLERPFDLGGDDPRRLANGLPVLLDALPRQPPANVLCFRCGYGALPLIARSRWPEAQVIAVERDLLATTFIRRNAERLKLGSTQLEVREAPSLASSLQPGERFALAIGELSPSSGERVAAAELEAVGLSLEPDGQALILSLEKLEREWIRPLAARHRVAIHRVISRQGYAVLRMAPWSRK